MKKVETASNMWFYFYFTTEMTVFINGSIQKEKLTIDN